MRSSEQDIHRWVQRLAEDPAHADNPLLAEFRSLADRHVKLLRQLTKIAKISDRLQGETKAMAQQQRQFVLMISHEFRTPLAIIDSASQMMEMEPQLPAPVVPRLRKIRNAVGRMLHLIDRCLADDRLGRSGEATVFDLPALLTGLVADALAGGPIHRIEATGCDHPLPVTGDRELLSVVFSNLVENAVKYAPNGGVIRLALSREGEYAVVRVSDEGIGINAADAERVFDKFYRASNAAGTTGAGLGLYLARRIVEAHGGSIELDSVPDRGSTFAVRLPASNRCDGASDGRARP
ncbi:sensor histidine kinase [Azospirillum thermophilum]|uniref:histidine kinase n=1 Tax=Azospirillum thermophilum TaxID=2202148 RepID=A0A2S2CL61_9PROT|nr:HAMP domain-containing sensor histidine kinase [Azospirillum thermophilum]AWK85221.1 sensor histidine kinase [Azospirillum thermophilum]